MSVYIYIYIIHIYIYIYVYVYIYIYICLDSGKDSDSLRHTGALVMRFEPSDQRVSRPGPSSAEAFGYMGSS